MSEKTIIIDFIGSICLIIILYIYLILPFTLINLIIIIFTIFCTISSFLYLRSKICSRYKEIYSNINVFHDLNDKKGDDNEC